MRGQCNEMMEIGGDEIEETGRWDDDRHFEGGGKMNVRWRRGGGAGWIG